MKNESSLGMQVSCIHRPSWASKIFTSSSCFLRLLTPFFLYLPRAPSRRTPRPLPGEYGAPGSSFHKAGGGVRSDKLKLGLATRETSETVYATCLRPGGLSRCTAIREHAQHGTPGDASQKPQGVSCYHGGPDTCSELDFQPHANLHSTLAYGGLPSCFLRVSREPAEV